MMFLRALKYKFLEYCIDMVFDRFYFNLVNLSNYHRLTDVPKTGQTFSELISIYSPNRIYRNCKVTAIFENSDHEAIFCNVNGDLYIDGKLFRRIDFIIDIQEIDEWIYMK